MDFAISALGLFGVLLALYLRFKAVGIGAAVIALLFGFYLARSGASKLRRPDHVRLQERRSEHPQLTGRNPE